MDKIQFRRDTLANWNSVNPILSEGEIGYVLDDPNLYKMGDGIKTWNQLLFRGFDGTIVHDTGDSENVVMSQKATTEKIAELEVYGGCLNKLDISLSEPINEDSIINYLNGEILVYHKDGVGAFVTELIVIEGIKTLFLPVFTIEDTNSVVGHAFYDKDMKYISGVASISGDNKTIGWEWKRIAVPQNARFIRCSVWNKSIIKEHNLTGFAMFGDKSIVSLETDSLRKSLRTTEILDLSLMPIINFFPSGEGVWVAIYEGYMIPCSGGDRFIVTAQETSFARVCFVQDTPNSILSNANVKYASGYSGNGLKIEANTKKEIIAPSDAAYLYVLKKSTDNKTPIKIECDAILIPRMWNFMEDTHNSVIELKEEMFGQSIKWESGSCIIADPIEASFGEVVAVSRFDLSDYVKVIPGMSITYSRLKTYRNATTSAGTVFFDEQYLPIDGIRAIWSEVDPSGYEMSTITIPSNAYYVRFTRWNDKETYGEFSHDIAFGVVDDVNKLKEISNTNSNKIKEISTNVGSIERIINKDVNIINVDAPQSLDKHIFATISTYMVGYEDKKEVREIKGWTENLGVLAKGDLFGQEIETPRYSLSPYISVKGYKKLYYSNIVLSKFSDVGLLFYDDSYNIISGIPVIYSGSVDGYKVESYNIPFGAAFVRATKWNDDATYGEFTMAVANPVMIFSKDLGRTWDYIEADYGTIQLCHIFSDGSIVFANTNGNVYRTEDYKNVVEVPVYGLDGNTVALDWGSFFEYKSGDSWVFDNEGNEMFVFGEYRLDGKATRIWYTKDNGKSFQCAHEFGTSLINGIPLWVRHVHQVIYDKYRNYWYVITGDEGTECNLLKGLYDRVQDKWSFEILAQGQDFKFGEIRILKDEIILTTDYTYEHQIADRGLLICNKNKLHDPSAYRYLANFPAEWLTGNVGLTHLFVDKNGNQLVLPDYLGYGMFFLAQKGQEFKKCVIKDNDFLLAGNIAGPNFNGDVYISTRRRADSITSSLMGRWVNLTRYLRELGIVDFMKESIYFPL